jgi:hypothetical protein
LPRLPGIKVVGKIDLGSFESSTRPRSASPAREKAPVAAEPLKQEYIDSAFEAIVDKNTGLAECSLFNNTLRQLYPTFNYKHHGFATFRKFCESLAPAYFVMQENAGMRLKKGE